MERPQYDFPALRVFAAMAVTSLLSARMTAQPTGAAAAENLKPNVVRIEAQLGDHTEFGFGFIVGERSGKLYIVTANHVVYAKEVDAPPAKVKVEFYDNQGTLFDAALLGTHDVDHDLAVLTVPPPPDFKWIKQCLGRSEEQKRSTAVWYIGKSQKWRLPQSPGRIAIERVLNGQLELEDLHILPGSSGGPLVASSGIVGIIQTDSADSAIALTIDYVKAFFGEYNHPWDLEEGAAAVVATPTTTTPTTMTPTPAVKVAAVSPLREGYYELHSLNGQLQRPGGVSLHLRKVTDDYFLAEAKTPFDSGWTGELRQSGNAWDLKIAELRGSRSPAEGTALNPGSRSNEITKEGPLVTFKSDLGSYVWEETQNAPVERPSRRAAAEPAPSSDFGTQLLGALVSTLRQPRTSDQCVNGYVWREARPNDHVCVTPDTRQRTAIDNRYAAARRDPNGGPYGPETCLNGYVWRDAFAGDRVCVTPDARAQAASDNNQARSRVAH